MNARYNLLAAVSFNDAANAGSTPEQLVDAYRAEVLREAAEDERALDNVAMRAVARQRDEADARGTALEAEVVRLTAGQCTHTRRMCDLHHQKPVADCPYPNCIKARTATA